MSGVTLDGGLLHDVILIRHGAPIHDSDRPVTEWTLSAEGESKARDLGDSLVAAGIRQLVSSPEPKAVATARAAAEATNLDVLIDEGLREIRRPWVSGSFDQTLFEYFRGDSPANWEPIAEAVERFAAALERHSRRRPVGVVTHGTVMTAFLAANGLVRADSFWSGLTMPDAWQCMAGSLVRFPNNM
jgi:broad specificity phosphatase PhoE